MRAISNTRYDDSINTFKRHFIADREPRRVVDDGQCSLLQSLSVQDAENPCNLISFQRASSKYSSAPATSRLDSCLHEHTVPTSNQTEEKFKVKTVLIKEIPHMKPMFLRQPRKVFPARSSTALRARKP